MTRPDWPDDIETVAQRIVDKTANAEDAETVALWALQVAKFIRHMGEGKDEAK